MEGTRYEELKEGMAIRNGRLSIVLLHEDLASIKAAMKQEARIAGQDPARWQPALDRLIALARSLVRPEPEIDLFDFVTLTKAGRFPANSNQLIADSKCVQAQSETGTSRIYPTVRRLQMRLVPAYAGMADWLMDRRMDDTVCLTVRMFDCPKKQEPIFDENGVPHKIAPKRASYLPDNNILPGRVYEDKAGTRYLCLDGCLFTQTNARSGCRESFGDGPMHYYIKYTKVLEQDLAKTGKPCFNDVVRFLAARDKTSAIGDRISQRENPRKFVKEIAAIFDPKDTGPEIIMGAPHKSPYEQGRIDQYKYEIVPCENQ